MVKVSIGLRETRSPAKDVGRKESALSGLAEAQMLLIFANILLKKYTKIIIQKFIKKKHQGVLGFWGFGVRVRVRLGLQFS